MLQIQYKRIKEITPYEKNPRQNDSAVEAVAKSIKDFGFKNPIIIDKDGVIIAGHTRLRAAEYLGMTEVPTILAEDLTPDQVQAFRIADNKTAEFAEWDFKALADELEELMAKGFDIGSTGFNQKEIDEIMAMKDEDIEVNEDDYIVELPIEPISRPGDIWELGPHRLVVGDCTKSETFTKLMAGQKADMILTDPPYNVNYESDSTGQKIQNDNMDERVFYEFILRSFKELYQIAKPGAPIYIFHSDSGGYTFRRAFIEAQFKMSQCLIWVKNGLVLGRNDYHWKHEPILYGWKEGLAHKWYGGRTKDTIIEDAPPDVRKMNKQELIKLVQAMRDDKEHTTVIRADKPVSSALHPTMKPIGILAYLIKNSSLKGSIIVDPFAGSGSTMIAAEQLARTAYMTELDPRYADVIVDRYITFKGKAEGIYLTRGGKRKEYEKAE